VTGEFASNRIFRHGHAGEIVFINVCRRKLRNSKITEDFAEVIDNLLTTLRSSRYEFGFRVRSRQRNRILAA
jgi:hypothetical protein